MQAPLPPYFTDAEVDDMCAGLTQPAAMVRYLRRLGLKVDRKPNGRPLAWRPGAASDQAQNAQPAGLNVTALQDWAASRKGGSRGAKAQGR